MNKFSMFDCALRTAGGSIEDLGLVSHVSRKDFDERPTFLFRAQVPSIEYISLLIENALLLRTHRGGRVYANFQKLSRMAPVADLYLRIADLSDRLYVLGEADWCPPRHPNMRVMKLARDFKLAREWFLIAYSPILCEAFVGLEEEAHATTILEERTFRAFKTNDPTIVARLAAAAEDVIDYTFIAGNAA